MSGAVELLPCPFCGAPAHRITPMGFWEKDTGYSLKGVQYVCSSLYKDPPEDCPGRLVGYGDDAETRAVAAWNSRAVFHERPLTASALADAFDCVWNAVIGAAHDRRTGMDAAVIIAETFQAVANGLRSATEK